jgi:hypothetical protein
VVTVVTVTTAVTAVTVVMATVVTVVTVKRVVTAKRVVAVKRVVAGLGLRARQPHLHCPQQGNLGKDDIRTVQNHPVKSAGECIFAFGENFSS